MIPVPIGVQTSDWDNVFHCPLKLSCDLDLDKRHQQKCWDRWSNHIARQVNLQISAYKSPGDHVKMQILIRWLLRDNLWALGTSVWLVSLFTGLPWSVMDNLCQQCDVWWRPCLTSGGWVTKISHAHLTDLSQVKSLDTKAPVSSPG